MKKLLSLVLALAMCCMALSPAFAQEAYPIVKDGDEPITLTVFSVNRVADHATDYNETAFFQRLEEATGIHIEWIHPASSGLQEAVNLLFLGDKLPDIIMCGNLYNGGEFQGVTDGYFVNLAEYLPTCAPEYWSLITESSERYRDCANSEGIVPAFRIVKPEADPPYQYLMFRTDMLDELDSELPIFLEDYEAVFEAGFIEPQPAYVQPGESNLLPNAGRRNIAYNSLHATFPFFAGIYRRPKFV